MKTKVIISVLACFLTANACKEENLDKLSPNNYRVDTYYKTDQQLIAATNSIYAQVQSAELVAREYWFVHDLRSDDMAAGGGQLETARAQLLAGTHNSANALVLNIWQGFYAVIHRANVLIELAPSATLATDAIKNRVIGEAKFLRGWAYFELVSLYGGVPIYDSYVKNLNGAKPRSSEADVYAFAIQDLTDAASALPPTYADADLGRATQGAANALLGKVYMQKGDYANAKIALQKVIDSNNYSLANNYFDNFTEEGEFNKESIWEIGYANVGDMNWDYSGNGLNEKNVRTQEYSAVGWRNLIPSDGLLDEFERPYKGDVKEDPRLHDNFYFTGDTYAAGAKTLTADQQNGNSSNFNGASIKISWKKYSLMYKIDPGGFTTGTIDQRMLRYAEVLLNMAECINETGGTEAQVLNYLNMTRDRASVSMPDYPTLRFPTTTKDQRRVALMHEKRVEFAGEQIRNRDILRWRAQGFFSAGSDPISYFQANKFERLPIPQSEVDNNDKIENSDQNPGY